MDRLLLGCPLNLLRDHYQLLTLEGILFNFSFYNSYDSYTVLIGIFNYLCVCMISDYFSLCRPPVRPIHDGSPYKIRPGGSSGGLSLVPSAHLLQTSHVGPVTEPVTPPPPQVSHSNLSQVARAHPYAAALPAAPLPPSSSSGGGGGGMERYSSGQSSMPSSSTVYSSSPTYSRTEQAVFPLRSPPDRSGEFRRRLTLLPYSGLSPMDYGGGTPGLSGPGPGGGSGSSGMAVGSASNVARHHALTGHPSQMAYSTAPMDAYREPLMLQPLAPAVGASANSESAHKKMRNSEGEPLLMKATLSQPLRIDTRPISVVAPLTAGPPIVSMHRESQPAAYIPQVEAISPTLPGDGEDPLKRDDCPLRSTKDELLKQITKVFLSNRLSSIPVSQSIISVLFVNCFYSVTG